MIVNVELEGDRNIKLQDTLLETAIISGFLEVTDSRGNKYYYLASRIVKFNILGEDVT